MGDAKRWGHDELAHDLAEHLRANTEILAWEDMQLGPSGSARPDVYTMRKSYARFVPLAYECKISVADFRSDITSGKWQRYLKYASAVIFAVPAGLVTKADIPAGCGLIVRHESGWRTVKGPTLQRIETLPHDAWVKLMIDGIERQAARNRMAAHRTASAYQVASTARQRYGERIGNLLHNLGHAETRIEAAIAEAEKQRREIEEGTNYRLKQAIEYAGLGAQMLDRAFHELARAMGLPESATPDQLADSLRDARWRLAGDSEVQRLRNRLKTIERAFTEGLEPLPGEANDNTTKEQFA